MHMTPLWMVKSGQFAGFKMFGYLFNLTGDNIGYLKGDVAYSLSGQYLGEIYRGDWVGIPPGASRTPGEPRPARDRFPTVPFPDRPGLPLDGWSDPQLPGASNVASSSASRAWTGPNFFMSPFMSPEMNADIARIRPDFPGGPRPEMGGDQPTS
jgi:hypothetical protein